MDLSDSSSNDERLKKKQRKEAKKSKKASTHYANKHRERGDDAVTTPVAPQNGEVPASGQPPPPPPLPPASDDPSDDDDDVFFGSGVLASATAIADDDDDDDDDVLALLLTTAKESVIANDLAKKEQSSAFIASELRKQSDSTALALVDTSHEAHDVATRVTRRKMQPPSKEDQKVLRRLAVVNHDGITYASFQRDFYIPPSDTRALSDVEVRDLLKELDGAKVRGVDIPKPMRMWGGTGLNNAILDLLEEKKFANPFAVQCIGIPILMSGRDVLVTAKTGSGKTLSYLLPAIRHAANQVRCGTGEGPIALILVPTLELAVQVAAVAQEFGSRAGLKVVASHAGTPLRDNILQCRAGSDIMVATPGRLLDLATLSADRVLSFRRITYVVVDEADRMFDSGFGEHVTRFLQNVRPDRQTAFISATMPKELKKLLVGMLSKPIEISVGGRPTPASNVAQQFAFFDEAVYDVEAERGSKMKDPRFVALLHVLAEEGLEHLVLVFVSRKEDCDELFGQLTASGYGDRIAVLHNGMDKLDREFALEKYKIGQQYILVATSVAERGLDIANLDLVVNYTMPDHYEAYVHRIGRTGRAGKTGRAVSFFTRVKDDPVAGDLCDGLERAGSIVPEEMHERAKIFREKVKAGTARHTSSFVKGYKVAKRQRFEDRDHLREDAKAAGLDLSDDSFEHTSTDESDTEIVECTENAAAPTNALAIYNSGALAVSKKQEDNVAAALERARNETDAYTNPETTKTFKSEYPINDLADPIRKRLQAMRKEVEAETSTTIVPKGVYFDPRQQRSHTMRPGDVKLHLLIIGRTPEAIRTAIEKFEQVKKEMKDRERQKGSRFGTVL